MKDNSKFEWFKKILAKKPEESKKTNIILSLSVLLILILSAEFATRVYLSLFMASAKDRNIWFLKYEPYILTWDLYSKNKKIIFPSKKNQYRILILGGSTAAQMPEEVIEDAFQQITNRKIEVINLASGGWILRQSLVMFAIYGIQLQPDLIISIDGVNDIVTSSQYPPGLNRHAIHVKRSVEHPFYNAFISLFNHSQFVKALIKMSERKRVLVKQKDRNRFKKMINYYVKTINSMVKISKGSESKYVHVLQPYLFLRRTLTKQEQKLKKELVGHSYRRNYLKNSLNNLNNVLSKQNLENHAYYYISALEAFDNSKETCFKDEVHLTKKGQELLIKHIVKNLQQKGFYISDIQK